MSYYYLIFIIFTKLIYIIKGKELRKFDVSS